MKKILLVGLLAATLSGCGIAHKEDFDVAINGYVGAPIESLIADIGSPETTHETPSGYDYVFRDEIVATGLFSQSGTYCTLNVHVDKSSNIVKIDQSGSQDFSPAGEGDECAWTYREELGL